MILTDMEQSASTTESLDLMEVLGVDLVLWGDLRTMFDANAEDELWQNQERWNLKSWDLYENYGVHTLILEDGTEIHMLVERKYTLTKETLRRMLSLRYQELASQEQTTSGKDFSNPLMADSLPKTIQKRRIDDFKPIDIDDAVKDSKEAAGIHKQKVLEEPNSTKVEIKQEGHEESIRKRPSKRFKMKATKKSKRQKTDADLEEEEKLKAFLKIVPDEEGIIDYEVWRMRSDGSSRWIKTFSKMVTRFDRLDLVELYNLVMKIFETTTLEGVDLVLWGDLRTMFDANAEEEAPGITQERRT
ncbi:hypothetical protein Tco_0300894 [Tanacetum coccineum]